MKVIRNIVHSDIPPKNTNDLWLRSIADGEYELCLYTQIPKENYPTYGTIRRWVPIKTALQNSSDSVFVDNWYVKISTEEFDSNKLELSDFTENHVYISNNPIYDISEDQTYYIYIILRNDYKIHSITQKSIEGEELLFGTKYQDIHLGNWEIINTEYKINDVNHTLYKFSFNIPTSVISIDINVIRDLIISDYIEHTTGTTIDKTMSQYAITNSLLDIAADFDGFITLDINNDIINEFYPEGLDNYDYKIYFAEIKNGEEVIKNTFVFYSLVLQEYYYRFRKEYLFFKYDNLHTIIKRKLYKFEENYFYYTGERLIPVGDSPIKIVQEFGYDDSVVISQKVITEKVDELESFLFPKKLTIYTETLLEDNGGSSTVTIGYNYTQQRGENDIDFPLYYLEVIHEDGVCIHSNSNGQDVPKFTIWVNKSTLNLKFRYKETEESEFIEKDFTIKKILPYYYGFYKNMDIDESNVDELFDGLNKNITIPYVYPDKHIESSTEEHCCFYMCYTSSVSNITLTSSGISVPLYKYRVNKTVGDDDKMYTIYKSEELLENKIENVILKFE